MDETNSLIAQRRTKLADLRERGIDPYANKFTPSETSQEALDNYADDREVSIAGRIMSHRVMGKSQFLHIKDQSGRIQLYGQKQALGDDQFAILKALDLGDIIGVKVTLFQRVDLAFDLAKVEEQFFLRRGGAHFHERPRTQDVFLD